MSREINNANDLINLVNNNTQQLYVIAFYKHGCPPCDRYIPIFDQVARANSGRNIIFVKVDVLQGESIVNLFKTGQYQMNATPTTKFIKNGEIQHDFIEGAVDVATLQNKIKSFLPI